MTLNCSDHITKESQFDKYHASTNKVYYESSELMNTVSSSTLD